MPEPRVRVALLHEKGGKILLIQQTKNGRKYWLLPGGGVNYGETIADALNREMHEELNVSMEKTGPLVWVNDSVAPDGSRHIINLFFEGDICGEPELTGEPNITDFAYFCAQELETLEIHPPLNEALIQWLNGNRSDNPYLGALWTK